ncbi:MAG TPA: ABC transporter permease [Vicinamibacterales bacterium]|nr:ABC transporter permease [Vicinamibacterales bacterium]
MRKRDRAEEMETHIELYVEELVARGRTPEDARREARLAFGNPRAKLEEVQAMERLPFFDSLWRDLRYAVRVLRRTPAFTVTAIATLALVIGANTSVFSLAHAILLRPLPYPQPERLAMVEVEGRTPKGSGRWESHDGTTWEVMRDGASAIDVAVIAGGFGHDVNLVVGGSALAVGQARVGAGYFHVLGVPPVVGREFSRDDDRPGGPAVCVISYALWQRVFSGDAGAIGQSLLLRGERYDVIGVMPKGFENPGEPADVWTPVRAARTGEGGGTNFGIIARVKDGHTWQEAIAAMPAVDAGFFKRVTGDDPPAGFSPHFTMVPLQDTLVADVQQPIVMLGGAVFTVLLIACVNLAVLVLVRGGSRTKEIATRMALGGGRRDVLRQLMTESAVLGLVGGALGLGVGYLGLEALKALGGATFSQWTHVTLDGPMLAFTMGLALFTCLIFGLVPALQASRLDVQATLAEGGSRSIAGGSRPWLRRVLVGAEVALGVALLVVTALLIRAFVNLRSIDPGFDPSHVVTTSVSLQDARYKTAAQMNQLFDETVRRLEQTPGIESAAVSLELPYRRLLNMGFKFMDEPDDKGHIANVMYVTPDFFQTLRVPLIGGRAISTSDAVTAPPIVVVNQGFTKLASGGRDPMGRRIRLSGAEREIVGVVGDVKVTSSGFFLTGMVRGPITSGPLIYLPAAQTPDGFMGMHIWFSPMWTVRTQRPAVAEEALQRAIGAVDPLLPIGRIQQMTDIQAAATARQRLLMILVGVLGGAAVLLAAIGIHGLIAHSVQQRTREFGIRLALGATAGGTIRAVAMSGIVIACCGAVVGIGLAVVAVRLVESLVSSDYLWGVTSRDPSTYLEVGAFLVVVAAVASLLPALRIFRLDPVETLRA